MYRKNQCSAESVFSREGKNYPAMTSKRDYDAEAEADAAINGLDRGISFDELPSLPPLDAYAADFPDESPRTAKSEPIFRHQSIGLSTFDEVQTLPDPIVDGFLTADPGVLSGPGGSSKSTLMLWQAIHIVLGWQLFGREIVRPGPIVLVSGEDRLRRMLFRLRMVAEQMDLSRVQKERLARSIFVEDLTGRGFRLVAADPSGNLAQTGLVEQLVNSYRADGVSLVCVDPLVYFGPGERYVNDGEAALMQAGHYISAELDCATMYIAHAGKTNSREKASDAYASRGGSALPDGARFVHVLNRIERRDDSVPEAITDEELARGQCLSLNIPKLTDCAPVTRPIWIRRTGWRFEHVAATSSDASIVERDRIRRLVAFVRHELAREVRHSPTSLQQNAAVCLAVGVSRDALRALVHVAISQQALLVADLPKERRQGAKKTFLTPGLVQ